MLLIVEPGIPRPVASSPLPLSPLSELTPSPESYVKVATPSWVIVCARAGGRPLKLKSRPHVTDTP